MCKENLTMFSGCLNFREMRRRHDALSAPLRSTCRPGESSREGRKGASNRLQAFVLSFGLLSILCLSASVNAHHAVLRSNLEEMTVAADRVFLGKCISVQESDRMIAQGMMPVTEYTFQVERVIKGNLPAIFTFTQLGHAAKTATGKGGELTSHGQVVTPGAFIHGMGQYAVGERLLLFLVPESKTGNLTHPVGMDQGAFHVATLETGEQMVRNGINNLGLFTAPYTGGTLGRHQATTIFPEQDNPIQATGPVVNADALTHKRGALPLTDFLQLVDQINQSHGGRPGAIVSARRGLLQ